MTHSPPRGMFLAALACLLLAPVAASAQDTGWTIPSFDAQYVINADRTIDVTERIVADFGDLQKHGIYRAIPVKYARVVAPGVPLPTGRVSVQLDVRSVTDASGRAIPYSTERGSDIRLKIGDADRLITGEQTYVIRYRLARGLGFFPDHDELYWQVTGTEWPVPILHASATVTLPSGSVRDTAGSGAWCYSGWETSSSSENCTAQVTGAGAYAFTSNRLDPGEGLTFAAAFPKGVIAAPTTVDNAREMAGLWWPALLPILAFGLIFQRWRDRGREPDAGSIVPNWHPPADLPAGAAGALADQRVDMRDIVATLLDLAVRGYVTIKEVPLKGPLGDLDEKSFIGKAMRTLGLATNDWELARTDKPVPGDLAPFELSVLDGVFDDGGDRRRMSDLHNDFYTHIPGIKTGIYAWLVEQRYFLKKPDAVRNGYMALGIVLLALGIPLGAVTTNIVLGAGVALCGIVVLIFSGLMPAKTTLGARRWREVKGLEEYIRRAEKSELEMSQGPERTTELFSTLLPYAVALDVSDIWMKQFAGVLESTPPNWYSGSMGQFNMASFSQGLSGFQTAATRTLGSSPGSSSGSGGGGSVGGGGGGGGGGSW